MKLTTDLRPPTSGLRLRFSAPRMLGLTTVFLLASFTFAGSLADLVIPTNTATTAAVVTGGSSNWWIGRHNGIVAKKNSMTNTQMIFLGASVLDHWDAGFVNGYQRGAVVWTNYYIPRKSLDQGISGNKTQNSLWQAQNGEIDGINPKIALVCVGYNNKNTAEEIAWGQLAILREIRIRCPNTKILFMPYLPATSSTWYNRNSYKAFKIASETNKIDNMVISYEVTGAFTNENGVLKEQSLVPDNLHPSESGYQLWAETMEPVIVSLLSDTPPTNETVIIDNGDLQTTNFVVELNLSADNPMPIFMQISESNDFSDANWFDYQTNYTWTFSAPFETKTIYARFSTGGDDISDTASDTIKIVPEISVVGSLWPVVGMSLLGFRKYR